MGTQPVENNQPASANILQNAVLALGIEERNRRSNEVADRMAKTFAQAIIESQRNRPTPFWEHFVIVLLVTAASMIVIGVPIAAVAFIASRII